MNDFINAIILGIVEGFTEFLPISSTGHLILVNNFIGFTSSFARMFDVVIQLGAILAVIVYYWKRLIPFGVSKTASEKSATWMIWWKTLIGVTPALLIGGIAGKYIEEKLFNPYVVAVALLIGGIVLLWIEKNTRSSKINNISELSFKTAFFIGIIQCMAMIPGTSRSAATIIGAMLLGSSRMVAVEFSFFLAIPTMAAATVYSIMKSGLHLTEREMLVTATGFVTSFLVAWIVIAMFVKFISRRNFKPFGYYRIALGTVVLAYYLLINL
jgi:undecaprenyl-diphosphatase